MRSFISSPQMLYYPQHSGGSLGPPLSDCSILACVKGRVLAQETEDRGLSLSSTTHQQCDLERVTSTLWICFVTCKIKGELSSETFI